MLAIQIHAYNASITIIASIACSAANKIYPNKLTVHSLSQDEDNGDDTCSREHCVTHFC